ncbi:MAG: AMP-binding protein [Pseudomonadota bacterium]
MPCEDVYPVENANLYHILRTKFGQRMSQVCLQLSDGSSYSYAELDRWSASMAASLAALGASPGDRVVVQVKKSPAAVALYLACLRGGFVLVPLNTAYTMNELEYFIGDATPKIVVSDPQKQDELRAIVPDGAELLTLGGGDRDLAADPAVTVDNDSIVERKSSDLAAILYTSGTTGRSKGAMLSHGNLASNAQTLHQIWGFQQGDVLLHALPIFHVHGLFVAINVAMLNSSEILFLEKFTTDGVLEQLPRATVMMGVPTFYTRLLESSSFGREQFAHMRLFISGSAPLTEQTFEAFLTHTGDRILERYGMTETGMITSNPLHGERIAGTVGFALPGVEIRVSDEDGSSLQAGEVGTVEVKGPNVFSGYWNMPEKTAQEFRPEGWFITGDLGTVDKEGRLSIVGRAKDLIISGGYNVYPKEIELCLDSLEEIAESAVVGVPHPDFGEAVVAVCVASAHKQPDAQVLLQGLDNQLAAFKRPKALLFTDDLPRNAMGKVQKKQLRDRYQDYFVKS